MELALPEVSGVTWSVSLRDSASRMPLTSLRAEVSLRTASVGKVLLLLATARAVAAGSVSLDELLTREPGDWARDSGLWHTMRVEALPLGDVAALVGSVSDNLATNVLLRKVTLRAVADSAAYLGLVGTALHDQVRDERGPGRPPTLSTGRAEELSALMLRIATGTAMGPEADSLVRQWLSAGVDQTMVGRAFVDHAGLDPLAHHVSLGVEPLLWSKTGTDGGIRADVGAVTRAGRTIAWAAIANWTPAPSRAVEDRTVGAVLRGLSRVGESVLAAR